METTAILSDMRTTYRVKWIYPQPSYSSLLESKNFTLYRYLKFLSPLGGAFLETLWPLRRTNCRNPNTGAPHAHIYMLSPAVTNHPDRYLQ